MTITEARRAIGTLTDAMLEAVQKAGTRVIRDRTRWVMLHYRKIVDQHSETLLLEAIDARMRALCKKQAGSGETVFDMKQLCLDLGLPKLDLDDELSVPRDASDMSSELCDWVDIEDVTVDHIDLHTAMMDVKVDCIERKNKDLRTLKQTMIRIGGGRTDIPLRELRKIALRRN